MHRLTPVRLAALLLAVLTTLSLTHGTTVLAGAGLSVPSLPMSASGSALAAAPAPRAETAPEFSGPSAFRHVEALSVRIGSRVAGSATQAQTHQYLMTQLQSLGYQTTLQPFPINAYQDRGSTLVLRGASAQTVAANTLQYSAAGAVEGELIDAGLGRDDDFNGAGAAGRIALVTRGEILFEQKVDAAARAGALAVIIANHSPGNYNGSLRNMSAIPAVSVSQEDGEVLRQAIRAGGATIRVEVNASTAQSTGSNVVGVRPGGAQTLVIGAHIDSVAAGPGANDNASGTSVMLEMARVLASSQTPYTIQIVGFDAEEIGLVGSSYFVSQLSEAEKRSIVAMINFDMVGVGTESRAGGSEELVRLAIAAGPGQGVSVGNMGEAGASDHASFMRAGIPALFIFRSNDPNYHSPNDRSEYIDPDNLRIAGGLGLAVIEALARGG